TSPEGYYLNSVAYGNNNFVAVGGDNLPTTGAAVVVSSDGIQWQGGSLPSVGTIFSVTFGGGYFIAVSYDGFVLTSTNGLIWDRQSKFMDRYVHAAGYLNSSFFLVGDLGAVLQSEYLVDEFNPSLKLLR